MQGARIVGSENGLSVGLGFRRALAESLFSAPSGSIDFVELAPENYLGFGGTRRRLLQKARSKWPVIAHGLALSLGGDDDLDSDYLDQLARFLSDLGTPHYSDHLCVGSAHGRHSHELLPLPRTLSCARHCAKRVESLARALGLPMAVEHISAYGSWPEDEMSEADFVTEVVDRSGCGLLLDLNNLYVNASNFELDPYEMLDRMPLEATLQIHMAGHQLRPDGLRIDTHSEAILEEV
ncbi:DUF692 domain-containing protein, partial [Myxococcota bacterium]|nr:DUF692 domain-containing protein [Myxococcota bacterium]